MISVFIFICRPVKLPAITRAIRKPKGSPTAGSPLGNKPEIIDDEVEAKPVVIPEEISTENQVGEGTLCVQLQPLTFRPVRKKLPTARRGKPFRAQLSGIKRQDICKIDESTQNLADEKQKNIAQEEELEKSLEIPEGDGAVELSTTSYEEWLAGLELPSEITEQEVNLKVEIEDITSDENERQQNDSKKENVKSSETNKDNKADSLKEDSAMAEIVTNSKKEEYVNNDKNSSDSSSVGQKLDFLKREVQNMIQDSGIDDAEDKSEEKVT